jgi:electron transport complex protein RnfD
MLAVAVALLPGLFLLCYQFGNAFAVNASLAVVSALVTEVTVAILRRAPVRGALSDGSWIVTALLIAAGIPGTSAWWVPCVAVFIGLALGKHCYGGLGRNVFNPAMVGYAFVLLTFPGQLAV